MSHRLAPEAESELDDLWVYVATQSGSLETADRLIDSMTDTFLLLARNPFIGRRRDEDLRPGLRSLPVGNYMILYRAEEGGDVVVLHVVRANRDLTTLFGI